jgi:hypothetical protein
VLGTELAEFGAAHASVIQSHQDGAVAEMGGGVDEARTSPVLSTMGSWRRGPSRRVRRPQAGLSWRYSWVAGSAGRKWRHLP